MNGCLPPRRSTKKAQHPGTMSVSVFSRSHFVTVREVGLHRRLFSWRHIHFQDWTHPRQWHDVELGSDTGPAPCCGIESESPSRGARNTERGRDKFKHKKSWISLDIDCYSVWQASCRCTKLRPELSATSVDDTRIESSFLAKTLVLGRHGINKKS